MKKKKEDAEPQKCSWEHRRRRKRRSASDLRQEVKAEQISALRYFASGWDVSNQETSCLPSFHSVWAFVQPSHLHVFQKFSCSIWGHWRWSNSTDLSLSQSGKVLSSSKDLLLRQSGKVLSSAKDLSLRQSGKVLSSSTDLSLTQTVMQSTVQFQRPFTRLVRQSIVQFHRLFTHSQSGKVSWEREWCKQ